MRQIKKAIIHGGSFFHHNFFQILNAKFGQIFKDRIYLLELENTPLENYDLLILSSRLNERILKQNLSKLLDFLKNGGSILCFGECELFENIKFEEREVNFWWWLNQGANLPLIAANQNDEIWNFLSVNECKWHYHGIFRGENLQKILVDELGEAIIAKDELSFAGTLYLTSLDPDFHIGQGFMPTTIPFLEKFMLWIEADLRKKIDIKSQKLIENK